jgi:hypothetical protein
MDLFKALEMQRIECQALSESEKRKNEEGREIKGLYDEMMMENRKMVMILKEQRERNFDLRDDLKRFFFLVFLCFFFVIFL